LSLPGFLLLLFGGFMALALLSLLIGVLVLLGALWLRWFLSRPPFTVVSSEKTLPFYELRLNGQPVEKRARRRSTSSAHG
jgi:hypothetical protein